MSIDKKTILHIASEIIVIGGISFYFSAKNKQCQEKISILEHKIQQQELIIQNHEQLLLKLLNNVNLLNNNINSIQQNNKKKKTPSSSSSFSNNSSKQKSNEINFIQDKNVNKQPLYEKPLYEKPLHEKPMEIPFFPKNNLKDQIIIMEIKNDNNGKKNSSYQSSSKVEEIPDEIEIIKAVVANDDDLDKELENELNEMELEKELNELNDVEEIKTQEKGDSDDEEEDDEDGDEDDNE